MRPRLAILLFLILFATITPASAGVYLTITRPSGSGPSAREQAAVEAKRQIDAARAEYRQHFTRVLANHPMHFELRQARLKLSKAHTRLADTRATVIAQLRSDPDYRRADLLIVEQEQKLRREQDIDKRVELASELLRLRTLRTEIESRAFSEDTSISFALAGVQSARNELEAVEKMYQWHLLQSDDLAAARTRLTAARDQLARVGN